MGCRGQVLIKDNDEKVYLYTHWGATELPETVASALSKKWRWDDFEYLARIIFDEMTKGQQGEETGYGIGVCQHGDIECLVTVDINSKTVTVDRSMYGGKCKSPVSFEHFITQ